MTNSIRILEIIEETTVDGPGFRTSLYCAGCLHRCAGCHNPQSWDMAAGTAMPVDELLKRILDDPFANVTYSGGDPLYQAPAFARLSALVKERSRKTIWCYTGFTLEELLGPDAPEGAMDLLRNIDVLVDGPYVQQWRDEDLRFRGSSNQRIIDVPRSLQQGCAVEWSGE